MHYLVLDLEMTGTEPGWHEIIQIGAVLYDSTWKELGRFLENVYPENEESFSIPAQRVHDLSMEDLEDAPMVHEVLDQFEAWVKDTLHLREGDREARNVLRSIVIGGQSVMYDLNFLRFAYREENREWLFSFNILDLHNLSYFLFEILKANGQEVPRKRSLGAIAAYFGHERAGETHNALEDSLLTGACLKEVMAYVDRLKLAP
ncbi:MAG: 3'-5' exonuclease [Bacteroidota bacterium]